MPLMTHQNLSLHVVPHVRWRREGEQTFQQTRLALVELLDELLDRLAQADQESLLLDGQAILLEDYLAVRPYQWEPIQRLVHEGRLEIGPWYVMTDPFLVSPEALVRNLLIGQQVCRRLGRRLDVGYLPDTCGQIGQLPQILRGFGITSIALRDGVGEAPTELWWESPDGSRVLLIYLRGGYTIDLLAPSHGLAEEEVADWTTSGVILLLSDGQADEAIGGADRLLRRLKGINVASASLQDAVAAIQNQGRDYPLVIGELRSGQHFPLRTGVLSARLPLKQRNYAVQTVLERWAEPFSAWATLLTQQNPSLKPPLRAQSDILTYAWRLLLESQATDSVRGSVIDEVQREVEDRLGQAMQVAEGIAERNLVWLAERVDTARLKGAEPLLPVVVFNSTGHTRTDLAEVELVFPEGFTPVEVIDETGVAGPLEVEWETAPDGPPHLGGEAKVRFVARDVPPFGYRTYALRGMREGESVLAPLSDEGTDIENEYLSLTLDPSVGTFNLFDKRTGRLFEGLNRYVDGGDRGDLFTACPPMRDTVIDIATNTPIPVERRVGPVTQTLTFLQIYRLPEALTADREARLPLAAQFVPISITTTLRITRGVPRVDVETIVINNAHDHRLRVHFPVGAAAQDVLVDGHFEVLCRDLRLPAAEETTAWAEQPSPDQPQRAFVTLLGSDTGLTLANRGLPEVAVLVRQQGVEIALTLLRCVGWLSRDDLPNRRGAAGPQVETPLAQCPGEHTLAYSIIPHAADPLRAWWEAWAFQSPLRAVVTTFHRGVLPPMGSLIAADNPAFVLSAVKMAEDGRGLIVRGYSVSGAPEEVTLRTGIRFTHAERVWLDESPMGKPLKVSRRSTVRFAVHPAEIVTLRLGNEGVGGSEV